MIRLIDILRLFWPEGVGETRTSQQKGKKKETSLDKRMAQQKGHVWSI